MNKKQELMMDSGAFSVWSNGAEVDVKLYTQFCLDHMDCIDTFIALDVIPGQKGEQRQPTKAEMERACAQSWDNYKFMVDAGIPRERLVPVFHQFDDFKWLRKFMEFGVPYLGLSPKKQGVTRSQHQSWLDSCMNYTTDDNGMPLVKTHGFGMTSITMMLRYPWYSVDSSTALKEAIYGSVSIPWKKNGEWNFLHTPRRVSVSTKSGDRKMRGAHVLTLSPHAAKMVQDYLDMAGITLGVSKYVKRPLDYIRTTGQENMFEKNADHHLIEEIVERGLTNSVGERTRLNIFFFEQVENSLKGIVRKFDKDNGRPRLLALHDEQKKFAYKKPSIKNLRIYIAGCNGSSDGGAGADLKCARHRLLSYHFIENSQKDEWEEIIQNRRNK